MSVRQIIDRFGGIRPLARRLSVGPSRVQYWYNHDSIPAKQQAAVIAAGTHLEPPVCPDDFFSEKGKQ